MKIYNIPLSIYCRDLHFAEPDEPKLLKDIGIDRIFFEVVRKTSFLYSFEANFMEQLLMEQRCVLHNHAYIVMTSVLSRFDEIYYEEIQSLSKSEIEPGIFKSTSLRRLFT
ncbi:MAG: hypothetical protein ACXACY_19040 [Candidatus Hodarchaeales archaeon]|jgi:hypothetical protein